MRLSAALNCRFQWKTYGLHDIAMFNLLKVMEIAMQENEGNSGLTYEGLIEHIRARLITTLH